MADDGDKSESSQINKKAKREGGEKKIIENKEEAFQEFYSEVEKIIFFFSLKTCSTCAL